MRFCPADGKMVSTSRKFSWPAFIAWAILGVGWGALIYLTYYALKPKDVCTTCGGTTLTAPPPGYVLNPNTNQHYIPQELAAQQVAVQRTAAIAAPTSSDPTALQAYSSGEVWQNVAHLGRTICPSCRLTFVVERRRPLDVVCPACGATGTLGVATPQW